MSEEHARAAHAIVDDWIAYAVRLGGSGVKLELGTLDGGERHRFPQRLLASIRACNAAVLPVRDDKDGDGN